MLHRNVKGNDQVGASIADIFKFYVCCFSGDYELIWIFVLQCLDASHLIYGYGVVVCYAGRLATIG